MAALGSLDIEILEKRYPAEDDSGERLALRGLHLRVPEGQFLCILGPSGSGKTTLLNIIAGLDSDFTGRVDWPAHDSVPVIGYVFQEPRLLPWLTVMQNIELVLGEQDRDPEFLQHLLSVADLQEFQNAYPQRLSLGLARRVALVRAFAIKPTLLLMDEPFVSLDRQTAARLRQLLVRIWSERPTTVIFVTHNLGEALQLADRIVQFSASPGSLVADFPITLPHDARGDRAALERLQAELLREQPLLSGEVQ